MSAVLPVALMALAGMLVGGAWSLYKQGAARTTIALVGVLAVAALAGGILWLMPGDA